MKCVLRFCPCLASLRSRKNGKKSVDEPSLHEITPKESESDGSSNTQLELTGELDEPWYFGTMSRDDAGAILKSLLHPTGTFLLRRSDHDSSGYALSVKSSGHIRHFKVHQDEDNFFYIETSQRFDSLRHLVEHYQKHSLGNTDTRLGQSCPKHETVELADDDTYTFDLPKEDFTLEEELSIRLYINIYRGTWKKSQTSVIIKTCKDPQLTKKGFLNDIQPLKDLYHPHLVSLLAVCTESPPFYIVMELMEKGSLLRFLKGPEGQHQDLVSLMDIAAQVADGMSYLEKKAIVHKELAARNVQVGDGYICKVADCGLRKIKSPYENDEYNNCRWDAPEVIDYETFSSKSDAWSFGVLLYEIMTFGGLPYSELSNEELHERVSKGYRMPCPPKCPAFLYSMMHKCWSAKPEDRPSFSAIMRELDSISYEQ